MSLGADRWSYPTTGAPASTLSGAALGAALARVLNDRGVDRHLRIPADRLGELLVEHLQHVGRVLAAQDPRLGRR